MRTTLSVILPVRNGERHLGACLDSISLQKNDSMEILVLDDGEIVGKGTHKELLETCEVYRQIARSQLSEKELQGVK